MQGRDKNQCFQDHSRSDTVFIVGSLLAPFGAFFLWVVRVTWAVQGITDAVGLACASLFGLRGNGIEHDDCNHEAEEEEDVLGVHDYLRVSRWEWCANSVS